MATWTYSNWLNATLSLAITAVSIAAKTFTVAGDKRKYLSIGEVFTVDTGANAGVWTVTALTLSSNATLITVLETPASATVAGNVVAGPNDGTRLYNVELHYAEVLEKISAAVGSDGTTFNSQQIVDYLKSIVIPERDRLRKTANGGSLLRGRIVFRD